MENISGVMFIRAKTFQNKDGSQRTYLQLVESIYVDGKSRQRVLCTLGRLEELSAGPLDRLLSHLAQFSHKLMVLDAAKEVQAHWTRMYAPVILFRRLWEDLGIGPCLRRLLQDRDFAFPVEDAVFAMVLNRLVDPASKREVNRWAVEDVYEPRFLRLRLHHYYRALDVLAESAQELEVALYVHLTDLFSLELDLVFFDTTSTYFEADPDEGLRRYGHSRDRRPDRPQIVIGVMMTKEGLPIAHLVLEGNTADPDALLHALEALRGRFHLRRVVFVCDRGMVGKRTITALQEAGYDYIVGVRLRRIPHIQRDVLGRAGRYRHLKDNLYVKQVLYAGQRYIVCFNPEEAKSEAQEREAILSHLEEALRKGGLRGLIGNKGYKKYLRIQGGAAHIDRARVEEEARYDGKFVLLTSTDLPPEEVALAYKRLWVLEQHFRTLKSPLELRPVFHWTEQRIRGHVAVCFFALVLRTVLEQTLLRKGIDLPIREVLQALNRGTAIELQLGEQLYLVRTELTGPAAAAFQALGIQPPPRVQPLKRSCGTPYLVPRPSAKG